MTDKYKFGNPHILKKKGERSQKRMIPQIFKSYFLDAETVSHGSQTFLWSTLFVCYYFKYVVPFVMGVFYKKAEKDGK